MNRVLSVLVVLVGLALVQPGCSTRSMIGRSGELAVSSLVTRGPYLDVTVQDDDVAVRVFADAADADCKAVLSVGNPVEYANRGVAGRITADGLRCDLVGIGDPFIRRVSQSRGLASDPIPRAQATYERIYEDDDVALLRGRFPLTGRVGWAGGVDTVVVVQARDTCRRAIDSGVASMEFRPRGINTLALVSGKGLCRIDGLILPR
jgi:hypothetical protein